MPSNMIINFERLFYNKKSPAAAYFPAWKQYHRRKGAWLPCSEWERVFPPRYGHRAIIAVKKKQEEGAGGKADYVFDLPAVVSHKLLCARL